MSTVIPGFDAPAVGFEQPFEMLAACHERMRRSLALLQRLIDHVDVHGHDAQVRSAAADVQRYFDIAAPLHHEDEERHVFPLLEGDAEAAPADAALAQAAAALRADHTRMETLWGRLRSTLAAWAELDAAGLVDATLREQAAAFVRLYTAHLEAEERIAFPAARARIGAAGLAAMAAEMASRRSVNRPGTPPST